jgi:hypothetical protein
MTVTPSTPERYPSLDAIRQANDELVTNLPEESSQWGENERRAAEARCLEFIARVVETGAILDMPADRKVAQGLINYWVARPYTSSEVGSETRPLLGRADTLLKPFDAAVIRSIVERSDAVLQALGPEDQALARRMLLRLLRISDGTVASPPRIKASLWSAEEAERGNEIVDKLRDAGAVVVRPAEQGELVELRYEALVRHWERLRACIDERIKFREAAMFWVLKGRDDGALVSAKLAKSAAEYGDLSDLEKEFVLKSVGYANRQWYTNAAVAALLFLSVPVAIWYLYVNVWVPYWATAETNVARASNQPIERRVDAIRSMAKAGLQLDLSEVELKNSTPIDLKKLRAPARWNFIKADLQNIDLTDAALPAALFNGSAIANSHFENAALENTRFDEAKIAETSFSESKLKHAVFDRAQLCQANFTESDITGASFRGVGYDNLPNFKRTAWWLAIG